VPAVAFPDVANDCNLWRAIAKLNNRFQTFLDLEMNGPSPFSIRGFSGSSIIRGAVLSTTMLSIYVLCGQWNHFDNLLGCGCIVELLSLLPLVIGINELAIDLENQGCILVPLPTGDHTRINSIL
jgi:hypothetical protein